MLTYRGHHVIRKSVLLLAALEEKKTVPGESWDPALPTARGSSSQVATVGLVLLHEENPLARPCRHSWNDPSGKAICTISAIYCISY